MLLALLLAASPTVADANAAGMKLYQAKRYPEAIEQFKAAIDSATGQPSTKEEVAQSRALALAHFNLACAMALARKAGKTCEVGAYMGVVWEHVLESIRLDPSRLEKAVTDPDLKELRGTLQFQSLLGLSPARESDLPKLLPIVTWYVQGGAYGPTRDLTFSANGTVELTLRLPNADGFPLDFRHFKGRWTLKGRELKLVFSEAVPEVNAKEVVFTFSPEGSLRGALGSFSEGLSECEA